MSATVATDNDTVRLGHSEHDKADALGVLVERGYLYWVRPDNDEESGEKYGYHGNDVPPCAASYAADEEDSQGGYLVISESPELPECVDGWTAEAADLDEGTFFNDGTARLSVLKRHVDGRYTICGTVAS